MDANDDGKVPAHSAAPTPPPHPRDVTKRGWRLGWAGLGRPGQAWAGLGRPGQAWTGLDWTGLDWTGLDWTCIGLT